MNSFAWHSDEITMETQITKNYKNTQNVRCFLKKACGANFKFNREFMAWIKNGEPKIMGDILEEWLRLEQ